MSLLGGKMFLKRTLMTVLFFVVFAFVNSAYGQCNFVFSGNTMTLQGDCTTSTTILVPDGFTLNGKGHLITAVDPPGGHFVGPVIKNGGSTANVINTMITASNLVDACDGGADRLRGIWFQNASGKISGNVINNLNQGASGCQEGNSIEASNFEPDGITPAATPVEVEVSHNFINGFQKGGIVINGNVEATVTHNKVGPSATQAHLAANGIQLAFGASGLIEHNQVAGNSWCCEDAAATAILIFQTADGEVVVSKNNIQDGNADVGIFIEANGVIVDNNKVFDEGPDGFYDIGIGAYGTGIVLTNNKIKGFDIPIDTASAAARARNRAKSKVIPFF
jgi:hypothetical protein